MCETTEDGARSLPAATRRVELDGRTVYLVGTAHVSRQSVEDVRATVEAVEADAIAVELCPARHRSMTDRKAWADLNLFAVVKQGRSTFLLVQLVLSAFYRRLGEKLEVQPGAEMMEGVRLAGERGIPLVLADRAIDVTLKRVWRGLNLWHRLRLFSELLAGVFAPDEIDAELIEEIKQRDELEAMMDAFTERFPVVRERLIDERDLYLAEKIRRAPGQRIVAVLGAGHLEGVTRELHHEHDLGALEELPPKPPWAAIVKWAIPAAILGLIIYGFFRGGTEHSLENIGIWLAVNGTLAALGTALACGHPLTIASALVAAPFTSLNPMIAAGWVAGLVQAWIRPPKVEDVQRLPEDASTVRGFWRNPASRILLVVILANVGSTIGTFVSGWWIAARTL